MCRDNSLLSRSAITQILMHYAILYGLSTQFVADFHIFIELLEPITFKFSFHIFMALTLSLLFREGTSIRHLICELLVS